MAMALPHGIKSELEQAIADFTTAIKLDPGFRDAYLNRGYARYTARDWERAIDDYAAAINIDPDYPRAYALRLELYRGSGRPELAIADLTQLIRLDPKNPELLRNRGVLWMEHGDHDRAIADFTRAIKLNPKFVGAYALLGALLIDRDEFDRAIAVFTEAAAADPLYAANAIADRGDVHFLRADYAAAARQSHGCAAAPAGGGAREVRGYQAHAPGRTRRARSPAALSVRQTSSFRTARRRGGGP
jgi:tetratricopeptide (TPR) repeat protein